MLKKGETSYPQFLLYSLFIVTFCFISNNALSIWNYLIFHFFDPDWVFPLQSTTLKLILLLSLAFVLIECFLFFIYRARAQRRRSDIVVFLCSLFAMALIYFSLYAQVKMDIRRYNNVSYSLGELKTTARYLHALDIQLFKPLKIVNLHSVDDQQLFSKELIRKADVKNFDDFYSFANKHFANSRALLQERWKISSPDLLKTLFFMNMVSGMWGYGNEIAVDKRGCALLNEQLNHIAMPDEKKNDVRVYIDTDIGCCIDSAYVLRHLLTNAKIKNRIVLNPGHVFNEAFIDGIWMAFDATTNIWWHSSWEQIQNAALDESFYVTLFSHSNLVIDSPYYRPAIGQLRTHLLLQAVYKMSKSIQYPETV